MRKTLKPKAYIYPLPVLIIGTYDENGTPNAMNAAWGTVADTDVVSVCLSSTHKTVKNLIKTKAFTLSIADVKNVAEADYVGIVSGNKTPDKLQKTGWTTTKSENVNAPIFDQLPLCLECEVIGYDLDTEICMGKVVGVSADEKILDKNGKIDLSVFKPIAYDCDTHGYYTLGERVGEAFCDGKKL